MNSRKLFAAARNQWKPVICRASYARPAAAAISSNESPADPVSPGRGKFDQLKQKDSKFLKKDTEHVVQRRSKSPPPHLREEIERCFNKLDLKFEDTKTAFKSKSNWELFRALVVLKLCSFQFLVKHNMEIMKSTRKVLGKKLFETIMKLTFYGHFVAGEDQDKIRPAIDKMRKYGGVKAILDYSAESDLSPDEAKQATMEASIPPAQQQKTENESGSIPLKPEIVNSETKLKRTLGPDGEKIERYQAQAMFGDRREGVISARTYFYGSEPECDKHAEIFCKCIDAVHDATGGTGLAAIKMTALGRPAFLLQLSEVIAQTQNFYQTLTGCPWEDLVVSRLSKSDFLDRLEEFGVKVDHAQVQEWFSTADFDADGFVDIYDWGRLLDHQMNLSKLFQVLNLRTGKMDPLIKNLTEKEEAQFKNMMGRLLKVADRAAEKNVRLMIDAEQTYFQPAIARLTTELMRRYNKNNPYLKNAVSSITLDMHLARREDYYFGAKLVRGAYLDQERKRAIALGYEDPTNPNYEATSAMYLAALKAVLEESLLREPQKVSAMCATHNEDTVREVVKKMREYGIAPSQRVICFGQLYGMCDQVSFSLGQAGYSVYKYVPYGPVEDVLPYLSRRAQENSGLIAKSVRERGLIRSELLRRLRTGQFSHRPEKTALV